MPADLLLPRLLPPALTLLAQSTLILALGLLAVHALRRRGPAAQSLLCRATLAAVLVGAALSGLLAGRITPLWRIALPQAAPRPPILGEPERTAGRARGMGGARQAAPLPVFAPEAHPQPPPRGGGGETLGRGQDGTMPPLPQPAVPVAPVRESSPLPAGRGLGVGLLLALSLTGTLLQLLWLAGCQHYLARLRRRSRPITAGDAADTLAALCAARRLAPPVLLASPQARGPFLTGVRHPALVLPATYESDFDRITLRAVLAHEVAHLARRDCAWLLLTRLTGALLWPQPLVWLLARQLERAAEEACDREAQAAAGSPRAYADCLLRLAERGAAGRREAALSAAVVPFRSSLGRRIHALLQKGADPMPAPTARLRAAVTLSAVAAAVLGGFLVSFGQSPPTTPTSEQEKSRAQQQACLDNLTRLGRALNMYAQDNDETFPPAQHWVDCLSPYLRKGPYPAPVDTSVFHDPAAPQSQQWSYAFNRRLSGIALASINAPAYTVAFFDTTRNVKNASDTGQSLPHPGRHRVGGAHAGPGSAFAFADGHAKVFADDQRPSFSPTFEPTAGALTDAQRRQAALVASHTKQWVRLYVKASATVHTLKEHPRTAQRRLAVALAQRDAEIASLKARVQQLERAQQHDQRSQGGIGGQRGTAALDLTPVQGPGVIVTLNDSHKRLTPGASQKPIAAALAAAHLIHDQDIVRVLDALRAAGAEALAVNGQRLAATSAIVARGHWIYVNELPQEPPYRITAIGDSRRLTVALNRRYGIAAQLRKIDSAMISIQGREQVTIPAYHAGHQPGYARPITLGQGQPEPLSTAVAVPPRPASITSVNQQDVIDGLRRLPDKSIAAIATNQASLNLYNTGVKRPARTRAQLGVVNVNGAHIGVATQARRYTVRKGSYVSVIGRQGNDYEVLLPKAEVGYVRMREVKLLGYSIPLLTDTHITVRPRQRIFQAAQSYLGVPYKEGGTTSSGFDDAGLVRAVYRSCGITLPTDLRGQASSGSPVRPLDSAHLEEGDRLYFTGHSGTTSGIYVGGGFFIHASRERGKVVVDRLSDRHMGKPLTAARRSVGL